MVASPPIYYSTHFLPGSYDAISHESIEGTVLYTVLLHMLYDFFFFQSWDSVILIE